MRTMQEIDNEARALVKRVTDLRAHFDEVCTWPKGDLNTLRELQKIADELIPANRRMAELIAEKEEIKQRNYVQQLGKGIDNARTDGTTFDFIT